MGVFSGGASGSGGGAWNAQEFLASGNFIVPAGIMVVLITATAGGGAGAYSAGSFGGRSGEHVVRYPLVVVGGDSLAVTVGAGAPSVVSWGVSGVSGGDTVIIDGSGVEMLRLKGGAGGYATYSGGIPAPYSAGDFVPRGDNLPIYKGAVGDGSYEGGQPGMYGDYSIANSGGGSGGSSFAAGSDGRVVIEWQG